MEYRLDRVLLKSVQTRLGNTDNLYWILGGSCTGKSTVTHAISRLADVNTVDMDGKIYGEFFSRYSGKRHPAITSWFGHENPLGFVLGLSDEEFMKLNRATIPEILDILVDELERSATPTIFDGGLTHPSVLVRFLPKEQIVCLDVASDASLKEWSTTTPRLQMKDMVKRAGASWDRFLATDRLITETMSRESREAGIRVFPRSGSPEELARSILDHFGIPTRHRKKIGNQ